MQPSTSGTWEQKNLNGGVSCVTENGSEVYIKTE